jgi:sialate O-acetylesterase
LIDLKGYWKFELGDNQKWAEPDFDDGSWEEIYVPATWEDEGFPGYDGYAWYRKEFTLDKGPGRNDYYLFLGHIDDVDEAYINGNFVGFQGLFPPGFASGYMNQRQYRVPKKYLNFNGKNVIAVRVYDVHQQGGIVRGKIGFYEFIHELNPLQDLSGNWSFKTGDSPEWKDPHFDDSDWDEIIVPAVWETQGYKGINGIAWYRTEFKVDKDLADERLILLMGKIDDFDETYLNGRRIGRTGIIHDNPDKRRLGNEWAALRAYYIPSGYLNKNGRNILAVRVYDGQWHGGIYEGPIGFITRDRYRKWKNVSRKERNRDFWEWLFDN